MTKFQMNYIDLNYSTPVLMDTLRTDNMIFTYLDGSKTSESDTSRNAGCAYIINTEEKEIAQRPWW